MKLPLQARIHGCDGQSRRSALRHTARSMPQGFTPPSACRASHLHAFATNLH